MKNNYFSHFPLLRVLGCLLLLFVVSCRRTEPIVILFENDVHCAVDGYERLAGQKAAEQARTPFVTVVSCGDFAQGNTAGSLTEGEAIVRIMNAVGYNYLTIGNHEFDYSVLTMLRLTGELKAITLCCNFDSISADGTEHPLFPAFAIENYHGTKVAYVGVATPSTFRSSTPTYFLDEQGRLIYNFHADDTYQLVQESVNSARRLGAEKVIVLSHLGDLTTEPVNSRDLISKTEGIDVVLDGHAHHVLNEKQVNRTGDTVLLCSTGTKFAHIGRLTIDTDNRVQAELLPFDACRRVDQCTHDTADVIKQELAERVNRVVGYTSFALIDRDSNDERLVRQQETNLGDFFADVARISTGADFGVCNGGGLRAGLYHNEITYGDIVAVWPFNNTMRVVECTGQELIDALEVAVATLPKENGDFMQVSGLRYVVDPSVPSSVQWDENHLYKGVGQTRRIVSVCTDDGKPLDPNKTYTIGGQSYIMASGGASGMFMKMRILPLGENPIGDVDAVIEYIHRLGDTIPESYRRPQKRVKMVAVATLKS